MNKPTKECKHEELLGVDYTDDYSVKVFGYRDKKGVMHITREEISNPKIDSILKEADKEFDDLWKHWIYLSEIKTGVNFNSFKNGIKSVFKYQITKAYKAGQESEIVFGVSEWAEHGKKYGYWDYFQQQTIKQIEKWVEENASKDNLMNDANLKAYYRFESGALTTDSSGAGHTLTAISDPMEWNYK